MFAKALLPRPADWADEYGSTNGYDDWGKHAGSIPKELRERLTGVTLASYRCENTFPVLLKIGTNVDASYDVQIKNFVHEGIECIGIRTIPTPAIISAGTRFAIRLPGAQAPADWALNSIVAATAAGTIATEKIQDRPPAVDRAAGGLIRSRYPFP
jgi:hypothetical protein